MKKILLMALLVFPLGSFAESIPIFPMTFFGSVTINDIAVPIGTKIKAYYGDVNEDKLAGEIEVKETGIYGYHSSIKQKLLVKKGIGKIIFTFQSPTIMDNQEIKGTNEVSYPGFESGNAKKFDMVFKYEIPVSVVPSSSGGGGGGGRSRTVSLTTNIPPITTMTTSLPAAGQVLGSNAYNFTRNLSFSLSGEDVKELQNRLTAEGVYTGPITGYFGPLTIAGVKAFQVKYGIEPVGMVGPMTRAKLNQGFGVVLGVQTTITREQMEVLVIQLQTQLAALLAR